MIRRVWRWLTGADLQDQLAHTRAATDAAFEVARAALDREWHTLAGWRRDEENQP